MQQRNDVNNINSIQLCWKRFIKILFFIVFMQFFPDLLFKKTNKQTCYLMKGDAPQAPLGFPVFLTITFHEDCLIK